MPPDIVLDTGTPLGVPDGEPLRACYDLNIWFGALLADRRGHTGRPAQMLRDAAVAGQCPLGPLQLIISASMTHHLAVTLSRDLGVPSDEASQFAESIELLARLGPARVAPLAFLGPTRTTPTGDDDLEDSHVLETALAGGAHVLVTRDTDFIGAPLPGRSRAVRGHAHTYLFRDHDRELLLVHPQTFLRWWRMAPDLLPHRPPRAAPRLRQRAFFPKGIKPKLP